MRIIIPPYYSFVNDPVDSWLENKIWLDAKPATSQDAFTRLLAARDCVQKRVLNRQGRPTLPYAYKMRLIARAFNVDENDLRSLVGLRILRDKQAYRVKS